MPFLVLAEPPPAAGETRRGHKRLPVAPGVAISVALYIHPAATDPAKPPVKIKKEAAKIVLAACDVQGGVVVGVMHGVFLCWTKNIADGENLSSDKLTRSAASC